MQKFFPPYSVLCDALGVSPDDLKSSGQVKVSASLLRYLIKCAVDNLEIDANLYSTQNSDIANAMRGKGKAEVSEHFKTIGYFENVRKMPIPFDETYYLRRYPDVKAAISSQKIPSGEQHFNKTGVFELRAPSAAAEDDAAEWRAIVAIARAAH